MKSLNNTVRLSLIAAIVVAAASTLVLSGCKHMDSDNHASANANKYTCAMHPEVVSDAAGKCPKCGMELVQKK